MDSRESESNTPSEWFTGWRTKLEQEAPALHALLLERQSQATVTEAVPPLDASCSKDSHEESLLVEALVAGLEDKQNASTRELAATYLRQIVQRVNDSPDAALLREKILTPLITAMTDEVPAERIRAIEVVAGYASPESNSAAIPALLKASSDPDPPVQEAALVSLGCLDLQTCREAVPALRGAMGGPASPMRRAAICALQRCQIDQATAAIPNLRAALTDDDSTVRTEAIRALAWLYEDAGDALEDLVSVTLDDPDQGIRLQAAGVLVLIDPTGGRVANVITEPAKREAFLDVLRGMGEKGRALRRKVNEIWDEETKPLIPGQSTVRILGRCAGPGSWEYFLQLDKRQAFPIPGHHESWPKIIALFAQGVVEGYATGIVPWQGLNACIDARHKNKCKATERLRQQLCQLNKHLTDKLGEPAEGNQWIQTVKKQGAQLNDSVNWEASEEVRQRFASLPRTI